MRFLAMTEALGWEKPSAHVASGSPDEISEGWFLVSWPEVGPKIYKEFHMLDTNV